MHARTTEVLNVDLIEWHWRRPHCSLACKRLQSFDHFMFALWVNLMESLKVKGRKMDWSTDIAPARCSKNEQQIHEMVVQLQRAVLLCGGRRDQGSHIP